MRPIVRSDRPLRSRVLVTAHLLAKEVHTPAPAELFAKLGHPERLAWLLGRFVEELRDRSFFLRGPSFTDVPLDVAAFLGLIADVAEPLDPLVASLLRWTAHRVRRYLTSVVGAPVAADDDDARMGYVTDVWRPVLARLDGLVTVLVEHWPADRDPLEGTPSAYVPRPRLAPGTGPCRYPSVAVGLTDAGRDCPVVCRRPLDLDDVFGAAAFALWQAGASDREIDDLGDLLAAADDDYVDVLAQWVRIDGRDVDAETRQKLCDEMFRHPVLRHYRLDDWPRLLLVDREGLDRVFELFEGGFREADIPEEHMSVAESIRSAAEVEASLLYVKGDRLTEETVPALVALARRAKTTVMTGRGRGFELALDALTDAGFVAVDRRTR